MDRLVFKFSITLSQPEIAYVDLRVICLSLDTLRDDVDPKKKLDDLIHLAELCIEVLQQNEEHHADVSVQTKCHASILCLDRDIFSYPHVQTYLYINPMSSYTYSPIHCLDSIMYHMSVHFTQLPHVQTVSCLYISPNYPMSRHLYIYPMSNYIFCSLSRQYHVSYICLNISPNYPMSRQYHISYVYFTQLSHVQTISCIMCLYFTKLPHVQTVSYIICLHFTQLYHVQTHVSCLYISPNYPMSRQYHVSCLHLTQLPHVQTVSYVYISPNYPMSRQYHVSYVYISPTYTMSRQLYIYPMTRCTYSPIHCVQTVSCLYISPNNPMSRLSCIMCIFHPTTPCLDTYTSTL